METSPMAGKSRQPSNEAPRRRRKKTGTRHTDKQWKERKGQGSGDSLQGIPMLRKMLAEAPTKLLQCPMDQEQEESWRMRLYLTNR